MSDTRLVTRDVAATLSVDPTPDGQNVLVIYTDEDLDSLVLTFTPANAARLGQMLLDAANRMQPTP